MPDLKIFNGDKSPSLTHVKGARIAAMLGSIVVLALLAPLIWAAVSAGVGLIVLMVIASVGIGIFQTLPLLAQKWENKVLELRREEARKRPIETLNHFLVQKKTDVKNFKNAVTNIGTQIRSLYDMITNRKKEKPNWDSSEKEASLVQMNQAHEALKKIYQDAEVALVQLEEKIEDAQFDWKWGEAGGQAIESINKLSGEDVIEKMLANEAFDSVRDNFNRVFSVLDMEAAKLTSTKSLSFGEGMTLDLSTINLQTKQLQTRG